MILEFGAQVFIATAIPARDSGYVCIKDTIIQLQHEGCYALMTCGLVLRSQSLTFIKL